MQKTETCKKEFALHNIFCDGVVLQQKENVEVWGTAKPNTDVKVNFIEKDYTAKSDNEGKWTVTLDKNNAGGPYTLTAESDGEKIVVNDVLIGEVWLLSGQSNMQVQMERVRDKYPDIIRNYKNDKIRQIIVPERYTYKKEEEDMGKSQWLDVRRETIFEFSAVGFFFAKALYEKFNVPVGLIKTPIGGSTVEAWMSREEIAKWPEKLKIADKYCNDEFIKAQTESDDKREQKWYGETEKEDAGLNAPDAPWYNDTLNDSDWGKLSIPCYLKNTPIGPKNGVFWFRKTINLPKEFAGKPARLFMGRLVDADKTYVNGEFVGTIGYRYPPRKYDIREGLLREGKNTITVRLISNRGDAEFVRAKQYELIFPEKTFDLQGEWKFKVGCYKEPLEDRTWLHEMPTGLFNGELCCVAKFKVKGAIYYQGESNTYHPDDYKDLFVGMIASFRKKLGNANLPLLYVQLPNYLETENKAAIGKWPLLRQAQLDAHTVPNTAMAVTIDVGEWNDLHPHDKEDVGNRLFLGARKIAYGEKDLVASGPIFDKLEINGSKAVVSFTEVGSGLVSKDKKPLRNFTISGADGEYLKAKAEINGSTVIVSCDEVKKPLNVRYAFEDAPADINFYNAEGLPASPFTTEKH